MSTTTKLEELSKEELLALLYSARQELVVSQKLVAKLDKHNQKLDLKNKELHAQHKQFDAQYKKLCAQNKKLNAKSQKLDAYSKKLDAKNKELNVKNKELEHQLQVAKDLTLNHLEIMAEMTKEAHYRVLVLDEYIAKPLLEQLESVFEESREWVHDAIKFRAQCYATGKDVKNDKSKNDTSENDTPDDASTTATGDNSDQGKDSGEAPANGEQPTNNDAEQPKTDAEMLKDAKERSNNCLDKIARNVTRLINEATEAVKSLPESMIGACGDNVKEIFNTPTPEPKDTTPKPSTGKKPAKHTAERDVDGTKTQGTHKCPTCGAPMDAFTYGSISKEFVTKAGQLQKYVEALNLVTSLEICEHCREVHCFFGENEDLPVKPNRSIGQKFCLDACTHTYMGIPLTRMASMLNMVELFGHSTVCDNFHDFIRYYLKPVYDLIIEYAKKANYILADGTPFTCLEKQGKGCCSKGKKNKKNKKKAQQQQANGQNGTNEELSPEDEIAISNYVLSFCNVPMAKENFVCYAFLPTRTATSIKNVLTEDFAFKTLICDAFQGYDTLAKEREIFIQNCLVHLRRYNVQDTKPDELAKELEAIPAEQRQAFIKERFQKGGDRMLMFTTYVALSKIYALESSVDRSAPDALEQLIKVRETEKVLMDNFEAIMEELVKRHLVLSKNGKKLMRKKGDPYGSFVFYWYQHKENFRRYLYDPMIPPDTNMVEQCIRPLTILRKNTNFMTSVEGLEDKCIIYTIWGTLKKNGINDPAAYLQKLCYDLYTYCSDKNYTYHFFGPDGRKISDPEQLKKKLITWDFTTLSQGFDFKKYFPFLND